ncbi:MAG: hypothetical protein V1797_00990 [Pseudomonadota bacterium]
MSARRIVPALLSVMLLIALALPARAGDQDFVLVNQTGVVIDELYVVPNNARTWEEDILGRDVLNPGESATISFSPKVRDCIWDLMVVDKEGNEVWWEDIDLCQHRRVTLTLENDKPYAYFD